jgi:hypothetical protein
MFPRLRTVSALALLGALVAACSSPPPPPPVEPTPPPPPPPPKCESLTEKCEAKADTKAKITNSNLTFAPAPGWTYAMLSAATVAQASDQGPVVAFMGYEGDNKDAKKDATARDAAMGELFKQLGLTPLKPRRVVWKSPEEPKTINGMKLGLWQIGEKEGQRGTKKGPILIVAGPTGEGNKGVIGVGFVPDDDKSKADEAIMKSIESLGKAQ